MTKPILLLDVDGVVANFVDMYLDIVDRRLGKYFTADDVGTWDVGEALKLTPGELEIVHRELYAPGACTSISPLRKALLWVPRLAEIADIWFVTSPLEESGTWVNERMRWIERHFGGAYRSKVINASQKFLIDGDVFVDDKLSHLLAWSAHRTRRTGKVPTALLWAAPGKRADAERLPYNMQYATRWECVWDAVELVAQEAVA